MRMVRLQNVVPGHIIVRGRNRRRFIDMSSQRRLITLPGLLAGELELRSQCLLPLTLSVCPRLINPRSAVSLITPLSQFDSWYVNFLVKLVDVRASGVDVWCSICVVVRLKIRGEM